MPWVGFCISVLPLESVCLNEHAFNLILSSFLQNLRLVITFYVTRLGCLSVCLSLVCFCMLVFGFWFVCFGCFGCLFFWRLSITPPKVLYCPLSALAHLTLFCKPFPFILWTWFLFFLVARGQVDCLGVWLWLWCSAIGGFFGHCVVSFLVGRLSSPFPTHPPTPNTSNLPYRSVPIFLHIHVVRSGFKSSSSFLVFFCLLLLCCSSLSRFLCIRG